MARAYAAELRERALLACEWGGASPAALARSLGVSPSTLYRWRQEWRAEGRWETKPHAGGRVPRLDGAALAVLAALVAEAADRTLAEYAAGLRERAGVAASRPTVCRALARLGLVREADPARCGAGVVGPRAHAVRVARKRA
jgi:transposase